MLLLVPHIQDCSFGFANFLLISGAAEPSPTTPTAAEPEPARLSAALPATSATQSTPAAAQASSAPTSTPGPAEGGAVVVKERVRQRLATLRGQSALNAPAPAAELPFPLKPSTLSDPLAAVFEAFMNKGAETTRFLNMLQPSLMC